MENSASRDIANTALSQLEISRATQASGWRLWGILLTLLLIHALCQVDRILPFILVEAIRVDLGLSDTQIGLITGLAFAVVFALTSLPLARAADGGSPRIVLVLCVLGWSVMTALGGFATGFIFLAITRLGVALGEAGATPAGHALISRKVAPTRRGLALGLFSMGIPIGTMLGFAIGGWLSDNVGWRHAFFGAGAVGAVLAFVLFAVAGPTPAGAAPAAQTQSFFQASRALLSTRGFLWLFIAANMIGLASAPFYAFAGAFLIRTHGFSASEAGLAFGLLQGTMGILGTLIGGRGFDRAVKAGHGRLLTPPAIVFLVAAVTTTGALFAPVGWISIALLVPNMLSFSFLLPWYYGTGHVVAGPGRQALASSLLMIGTGLIGPTVGPLFVGLVSDGMTASGLPNGLRWGMLIVPVATFASGVTLLIANTRIAALLRQRAA